LTELTLGHALDFCDLYEQAGLERIDALFADALQAADATLHERLMAARSAPDSLAYRDEAALILALAPHLEAFIADLFGIADEIAALRRKRDEWAPLYVCKRQFVQKQAKARQSPAEDAGEQLASALAEAFGEPFSEAAFARHVLDWLEDREANAARLETAAAYAAWALHTGAGRARHAQGVLFRAPAGTDPMHLVETESVDIDGVAAVQAPAHRLHQRDGFRFVDSGTGLKGVFGQAHYCIWCHNQGRDSCSKGMRDKAGGGFRPNAFGDEMTGCPLEEKISEMNWLMSEGHVLGALAAACVNNPMLAGTGHRICNDCMKACVYQKQEPVDIPQIETQALKETLALPWGFEVYSLLTRWNPMNIRRPVPKRNSGFKVLVVGLGPAGYTLAHHLMNDGHSVVAVDGLKIEPLAPELSGVAADGTRVPFSPVRDCETLFEPLESRVQAGFGGVAEYGITARWNKNYLKVLRLLLERRERFAIHGGVRFGGTITVDEAFAMGFDHIALCMGAGQPTAISMPNGMASGVRQASDFLMALQLGGAARADSLTDLQIRLPVVVVGGGLTAIDTATESLAYYPVQVEKFLRRYEALCAEGSEADVRAAWTAEEAAIADEFLAHARAIRDEKARAADEGREADVLGLLRQWGGVTIAYRRRMTDAPSYTLNHEEITMGLAEGIRFAELLSPLAVEVDEYGHAAALRLARCDIDDTGRPVPAGEEVTLPARSILIAAGTRPNTVLGEEDPANISLDGRYFQAVDADGRSVRPEWSAKPAQPHVLTRVRADGRGISFYGDMHPSFAGNVVRAMASARHGSAIIGKMFADSRPTDVDAVSLCHQLHDELRPVVRRVERLTPDCVEIIVRAPAAARAFRPGQFFRLQNYEAHAQCVRDTRLVMEGLAVAPAAVDAERGLISLVVQERGGSSDICRLLVPGEPVVLMGPTGSPTEIVPDENVLLIGGDVGNAMLLTIARGLKSAGARVAHLAAYGHAADCCMMDRIETTSDMVIWCCEKQPGIVPRRDQDKACTGSAVEGLLAWAKGKLGDVAMPLSAVDRIITIGPAGMMAAVAEARHGPLADHLKSGHVAIGGVNSPMQCMMKKICARCLQPTRHPETGEEHLVYTCSCQDQPLDAVDFSVLRQRLAQQAVHEKLTERWLRHCLAKP